jgi:hypothetical protein
MSIPVDIWLRGENHATTRHLDLAPPDATPWSDDEVRALIEGMLRAMDREKHNESGERPITLRGISWIVNPYEEGGVVLAIEIGLGAAIAGPFRIEQKALEAMVARVLARPPVTGSTAVH